MVGERVTPEGEQYVVAPLGIVHGVRSSVTEMREWLFCTSVAWAWTLVMMAAMLSSPDGTAPPMGAGGVGEGGSISAAVARAYSVRTAATCCSSSRSVVVARTRAQAASYLFFMSIVATTMALSLFLNSVASAT
jgi:hypothetical protein